MAEKKLVTLTDKNGVRTRRWVNIDEEQSENSKAVSKVSPKVNLNLHLGNGSFPGPAQGERCDRSCPRSVSTA